MRYIKKFNWLPILNLDLGVDQWCQRCSSFICTPQQLNSPVCHLRSTKKCYSLTTVWDTGKMCIARMNHVNLSYREVTFGLPLLFCFQNNIHFHLCCFRLPRLHGSKQLCHDPVNRYNSSPILKLLSYFWCDMLVLWRNWQTYPGNQHCMQWCNKQIMSIRT